MSYGSPISYFISRQIWMYNGSDLLSTVYPVNDSEMEFIWIAWY